MTEDHNHLQASTTHNERKESSLPEVDKDLRMEQSQEEDHSINIKVQDYDDDNEQQNENEENTDSFDGSRDPLTRQKLTSLKINHPMKQTMDFVYENSSSASPSHLGGEFPFHPSSPRYVNRRASGIPPPARALKNSDPLVKFKIGGEQKRGGMNLDEAEEEEFAHNR